MDTTISNPDLTTIEERLAAAGITAVAVASCDDAGCAWCRPGTLPIAA